VLDHLAFHDRFDRLAQRDLLGKLVLAVFQVFARLEHQYAADEHPGLIDDILARQQVGDVTQAESARDVDDLLAVERACGFELVLSERIGEAGRDADHQNDRENGVAGDDDRMTRAARWAGRLRHVFRLQCGSRTTRRCALRLSGTPRVGRRACVEGHVHSRAVWRRLSPNMAKG
jgi:hypothetical protein